MTAAIRKRGRTRTLDFAYEESGRADGAAVVLLHGFPYDPRGYDALVAPLVGVVIVTVPEVVTVPVTVVKVLLVVSGVAALPSESASRPVVTVYGVFAVRLLDGLNVRVT